jgi:AraC-like DNA-binding protein
MEVAQIFPRDRVGGASDGFEHAISRPGAREKIGIAPHDVVEDHLTAPGHPDLLLGIAPRQPRRHFGQHFYVGSSLLLIGHPRLRSRGDAIGSRGFGRFAIRDTLQQLPTADQFVAAISIKKLEPGRDDMSQVRAAVLTNFDGVAGFVGVDPAELLREAGLDQAPLDDPERMLSLSAVAGMLEEAARKSGCGQFGLLMAESRSLGSMGPVSLLLKHEPRLGDVIEAMVRHQSLIGDALHIESVKMGDATFVRVGISASNPAVQLTELTLALFCRCIAAILDRRWSPESIHFMHPAPADLRIHRRIFTCPIDFDSDFSGFVCTRDALQELNPAGDKELVAHAERLLALIMPPAEMRSADQRVMRTLRLLLPEGRGTLDQVARSIGVTPRSLQRQLSREGSTFGSLLDEIRRDLAQNHLSALRHVTMVAHMTGYQNAASFTRWFTAQFGMSPIEWRRQAIEARRTAQSAEGGQAS